MLTLNYLQPYQKNNVKNNPETTPIIYCITKIPTFWNVLRLFLVNKINIPTPAPAVSPAINAGNPMTP